MENVRLDGRTVLVTGGNAGIGKETVLDIAKRGARVILVCSDKGRGEAAADKVKRISRARVILACRDQGRGEAAAEEVKSSSGNDNIVVGLVDLASLQSVRDFAKHIKETESRLDILINNAGIMACPQWKTQDGFDMQLGTNHLGHFLLTTELLDLLKASAPSRVVNVSSMAHEGGKMNFEDLNFEKTKYSPMDSYMQSKLANILFTRQLNRQIQGTGVTTYSLHPGVINTNLFKNHEDSCCSLIMCFACCCRCCMKSPASGAKTTIYCAVAEGIEQHSGLYFSDCALKTPKPQAEDDAAAERLWTMSEEMVNTALQAQTETS